jgi:lipopolysaccharide transport system permease protein
MNALMGVAVTGAFLIGQWPGLPTLALIPLLMLQLLFALGLGILLGTLNVFFRDIGQLTGVVLQFWFWLTPIIYTLSTLPEMAQKLIGLNPLLPLIAAYQTIFLMQQWPDWASLWPLSLLTLFLLWLGGRFFLSRAGEMVDEL